MESDTTVDPVQSPSPSNLPYRPKVSIVPWVILFLVMAICTAWFGLIMKNTDKVEDRTPKKIIMPAGYTGSVKIIYGVEGEPALERDGDYLIVEVPLSGEVKTSTFIEYGQAVDEFYRVLPGKSNAEKNEQELERLNFSWVKIHKTGLVGDENEYVESSEELKQRDLADVQRYQEVRAEAQRKMTAGENNVGIPAYEIFLIRDDLE